MICEMSFWATIMALATFFYFWAIAKTTNYRKNKVFQGLDDYSAWPQVADAVIKAGNWMCEPSYK